MRLILRFVPLVVLYAFVAGLVALPAPSSAAADSASATPSVLASSLVVSPNTNLIEGQTVTVVGSGFTPGVPVGWCQAFPRPEPTADNCGPPRGSTTTDDQGSFTGVLTLQRFMFIPSLGATVDCANPPNTCGVGAAELDDISGTAIGVQLEFAPSGPPTVIPGVGTVVEQDFGTPTLAVPLTLTHPTPNVVTVRWKTGFVPGAPDFQAEPLSDYTPATGTVTFAPGETTKSATVSVNGDTEVEADEYLFVSFGSATNSVMGGMWGLGFGIIKNDDPPSVLPGVGTAVEGDADTQTLTIPLTLSVPTSDVVTVRWGTGLVPGAPGSQAEPLVDYTPGTGTVTFAPGETMQEVTVSVHGDSDVESDEYFFVSFGSPTNALMGGMWGLGFGIIENDD